MADEQSVWEKLGIPNPDDEENEENEESEDYEELQEEQDEEAAKQAVIDKKLTTRVDDLQKKFDNQQVANRKKEFLEVADPVAAELFKAVSADIKDMKTLDETMVVVLKRAEDLKATQARLEEEAREQAGKAWGVRPGAASQSVPENDEWEEMRGRARAGDQSAAFKLFNQAATSKKVSPFEK